MPICPKQDNCKRLVLPVKIATLYRHVSRLPGNRSSGGLYGLAALRHVCSLFTCDNSGPVCVVLGLFSRFFSLLQGRCETFIETKYVFF